MASPVEPSTTKMSNIGSMAADGKVTHYEEDNLSQSKHVSHNGTSPKRMSETRPINGNGSKIDSIEYEKQYFDERQKKRDGVTETHDSSYVKQSNGSVRSRDMRDHQHSTRDVSRSRDGNDKRHHRHSHRSRRPSRSCSSSARDGSGSHRRRRDRPVDIDEDKDISNYSDKDILTTRKRYSRGQHDDSRIRYRNSRSPYRRDRGNSLRRSSSRTTSSRRRTSHGGGYHSIESRKRIRDRSDSNHRHRRHEKERSNSRNPIENNRVPNNSTTTASTTSSSTNIQVENGTDSTATKRKRRTGWDSAPSAASVPIPVISSLGQMTPTTTGFTASLAGKSPEQIQAELAERQAQAASIAASMQVKASASQMCRIYVGSLDYSLTDQDIRQVFSAFGPIMNIDMPKEGTRSKGFCFVEYATPESADMAISTMPGFNLKGRAIKVGRPTALGGQAAGTASLSMLSATLGIAKTGGVNAAEAGQIAAAMLLAKSDGTTGLSQSDSQNRVYVGSVPYSFTADDIKQIFDVFGTILSCQLIPSNERPGTHRGYGFIEYSTLDEARLAIETMNDFPVAGKVLKVNYATALRAGGLLGQLLSPLSSPPCGTAALMAAAAATGANAVPVVNYTGVAAAAALQINNIQEAQNLANSVQSAFPDSCIVMLTNVVDPTEANNELKDEIQNECSNYGPVENIEIVIDNATRSVRIFVVFTSAQHATQCVPALHERWFGGRRISAKQYDPVAFAARSFWV